MTFLASTSSPITTTIRTSSNPYPVAPNKANQTHSFVPLVLNLTGDCTVFSGNSSGLFESSLIDYLASQINISTSFFQDFSLSCGSIIVNGKVDSAFRDQVQAFINSGSFSFHYGNEIYKAIPISTTPNLSTKAPITTTSTSSHANSPSASSSLGECN